MNKEKITLYLKTGIIFILLFSSYSYAYQNKRIAKYSCQEDGAYCSMSSGIVTWTHRCMHKKTSSPVTFIAKDIGVRSTSRSYYGQHDGESGDSCQCTYNYRCKPNYLTGQREDVLMARRLKCADVKILDEGVLCALRPSETAYRISDGTSYEAGYGYHVIGIPRSININKLKTNLHLTGTYGKPYSSGDRIFSAETFLKEGLGNGFFMIQLAYDNRRSVNKICGEKGNYINDCAGKIRQNKLTGTKQFQLSDTKWQDGIKNRLYQLERYLKGKRVIKRSERLSFENMSLSGHSQGAGMALYIAYQSKVKNVCLISGGYDRPDKIRLTNPQLADWIKNSKVKVTRLKIRALVHVKDPYYASFKKVFDYLNLYRVNNVTEIKKKRLTDSAGQRISNFHGATMGARELAEERVKSCFSH